VLSQLIAAGLVAAVQIAAVMGPEMKEYRAYAVAEALPSGAPSVAGGGATDVEILENGKWSTIGDENGHGPHSFVESIFVPGKGLLVIGFSAFGPDPSDESMAVLYDHVGKTVADVSQAGLFLGDARLMLLGENVLVAGGRLEVFGPKRTAASYLLNLGSFGWASTGSMLMERAGHSLVLLPNGEVLAACGTAENSIITELYDPVAGRWYRTGNLVRARSDCDAVILPSGKVVIVGGFVSPPAGYVDSVEFYDRSSGTWSEVQTVVPPVAQGRRPFVLPTGQLFFVKGAEESVVYNPETNEWHDFHRFDNLGGACTSEGGSAGTMLPSGEFLFAGGVRDPHICIDDPQSLSRKTFFVSLGLPPVCRICSKGNGLCTMMEDGYTCDDGNPCTESDHCDGKGECIGQVLPNCEFDGGPDVGIDVRAGGDVGGIRRSFSPEEGRGLAEG